MILTEISLIMNLAFVGEDDKLDITLMIERESDSTAEIVKFPLIAVDRPSNKAKDSVTKMLLIKR